MTQKGKKEKKQDTKIFIPIEFQEKMANSTNCLACWWERMTASGRRDRGQRSREVEALGPTRPFIFCAGEVKRVLEAWPLNCRPLLVGGGEASQLSVGMEGQTLACSQDELNVT